ncbi:MAG TPA: glycosyltransferase family 4 protein [Bryobacteraceae bacterium]|jgi:glycosyltransferase involved in cell wall biosynthesis|nr:glycosyltransferase family 4 protein [Bryobacteraceae bacterium]
MRILLTANASYVPPRGGATRSNLLWLEYMAARGHACRIVAAALAEDAAKRAQMAEEGADRHTLAQRGVEVHEVPEPARLARVLRGHIREFEPDWVLVSSEDLGHALLREAHFSAPGRVVYLAHTPQFFPFGPASWNPDPAAAELVARAAGVVAIGQHTAAYIRQHAGREAVVIHPPIYGSGPFPNLASFDSGLVTMVNPCAVKGISIFAALAARFPAYGFGALPGWGTTAADRTTLAAHSNIAMLPNCRHIAEFLSRTRVLLMPSLWYEGFGLTVMEAMLHGIPVIASDAGGLVEAKMGTPFVVDAPAIERYAPVFDEHALPQPLIGPIDLKPWEDALRALLTDRELYEHVSAVSREAALGFVSGLDAGRMLQYLCSLEPGQAVLERPSLGNLSPEKRALLLQMARGRKL